jgi:hypothetical protein
MYFFSKSLIFLTMSNNNNPHNYHSAAMPIILSLSAIAGWNTLVIYFLFLLVLPLV